MKHEFAVYFTLMSLAAGYGLTSYYVDHNFTWDQVLIRWGRDAIAMITHGGFWSDLIVLPVLAAWITANYGDTWDTELIHKMMAVGVGVALANHVLLMLTQVVPDPLGWKGEWWSMTIGIHSLFFAGFVGILGLFYFSPGVTVGAAVVVSIIVGLHIAFGTHILLGIVERFARWSYCPDFLSNNGLPWMWLGLWGVLAVFSTVAAGWRAGFWVMGIGVALVTLLLNFIRFGPPAIRPYA